LSSKAPKQKLAGHGIRLRIRVLGITGDAFGPGKAQLLEQVAKTDGLRGGCNPVSYVLNEGVPPHQRDE
jgi:hypothetical protein